MARARSLKPSFFANDALGELEPLARILFSGLWCFADREGRLEDRPKRIKNEILGYDDCDCNELLQKLHDSGFIQRYEADGNSYIQVINFGRHQNPHIKEPASTIPAPCKNSASTKRTRNKNGSSRADSLNPIPLTPFPVTDSLNPVTDSPLHESARVKHGEYGHVLLTDAEYKRLLKEHGEETALRYIAIVDEYVQSNGNKNGYKDWNLVVRKAIRDKWGAKSRDGPEGNIFFDMLKERGAVP